jgi:hypothetical protein
VSPLSTRTATDKTWGTDARSGLSLRAIIAPAMATTSLANQTFSPVRLRTKVVFRPKRRRTAGSCSSIFSTRISSVTVGPVRFRRQRMTHDYIRGKRVASKCGARHLFAVEQFL